MKKRKLIAIFIIIFTVLLCTFSFYGYQVLYTPNVLLNGQPSYLLIPEKADFDQVKESLKKHDYVHNLTAFLLLSKLMGYDEQVKPGRYKLEPDMSNLQLIQKLKAGQVSPVKVTFNNIRYKKQLAKKVCSYLSAKPDDLLQLMKDSAVTANYGFTPETIKAMFIPDTYEFYWLTTPEELLDRMKKEYDNFWNDQRKAKADTLGLSKIEVSILASIVDAETNKMDEASTIAGVYMNRLNIGMPLQADPTLVYAIGDHSIERVLNKHKEIESPYNTYKNRGLPPGPINVPSIAAIDAVLKGEDHNYLYFCARPDFSGYHNFASTLRQHNINARKYRKALNNRDN